MEKKTSSVEWLVDLSALMGFYFTPEEIQQAKEMHREEIINAYHVNPLESIYGNIGANYYNETFKA